MNNQFFCKLLLVMYLGFTFSLYSQNAPKGIYVSAGPTNENNSSIKYSNAHFDFVEGILVRIEWSALEPTDDIFDWAMVKGQIDSANYYGKKISLAIGTSRGIPEWLLEKAQTTTYTTRSNTTGTMVVPWDSIFMAEWAEFVHELGKRFNNEQTISLVYITNSSFNGYEMQLPENVEPSWQEAGYTEQKIVDSWKNAIDAFNDAFPDHCLSNDFHPILKSNAPADSIYEYAARVIGPRYGASAWWWTQKNVNVYPEQYNILTKSAQNTFATVQIAKNGTQDSALMGDGGLQEAIDLAIHDNIRYWEVWEIDIKNSLFHPYFDSIANQDKFTTKLNDGPKKGLMIYPNPANHNVHIVSGLQMNEICLYNTLQQSVLVLEPHVNTIDINVADLEQGIYIFIIIFEDGTEICRKVIVK